MDRRQRKIERKRKKRELARKRQRGRAVRNGPDTSALIRVAAGSPHGPAAVSEEWDAQDELPALVTAVVTRKLPDGRLLPAVAMVDRTCLGVKQAMTARLMEPAELPGFFAALGTAHGGMEECEPLVVQSIVFHAVDFARRLGFEPTRDYSETMFGPRPAQLLATPWSAPAKPIYISGPNDDPQRVMRQLDRAVGKGGYDFVALAGPDLALRGMFDGVDDTDDGDDDDGEVWDGSEDADDQEDAAGTDLASATSESIAPSWNLIDEIEQIVRRCQAGEAVVVGLGRFVLFSNGNGDAWLLDAFSDDALNLIFDGKLADVTITEDDDHASIRWSGTYVLKGSSFLTDALPGGTRAIFGYPVDELRATAARLRSEPPR